MSLFIQLLMLFCKVFSWYDRRLNSKICAKDGKSKQAGIFPGLRRQQGLKEIHMTFNA